MQKNSSNTKKTSKEYIYFFKGGGWNSIYATSKSEAYKLAVEEWKDSETLTVNKETIRLNNDKALYKSLLGLFN